MRPNIALIRQGNAYATADAIQRMSLLLAQITTLRGVLNTVEQNITTITNVVTASVADDVYSAAWDGAATVAPSQNAVYDEIETVIASIPAAASDTVYGAGWNGVTTIPPSKNAVYDKIEAVIAALPLEVNFGASTPTHPTADTTLGVWLYQTSGVAWRFAVSLKGSGGAREWVEIGRAAA